MPFSAGTDAPEPLKAQQIDHGMALTFKSRQSPLLSNTAKSAIRAFQLAVSRFLAGVMTITVPAPDGEYTASLMIFSLPTGLQDEDHSARFATIHRND